VHGLAFGVNGCTPARLDQVADEFCETQGYDDGFNVQTETLWGQHSGFHSVQGWINVMGTGALSAVSCQTVDATEQAVLSGTTEEQTFTGSQIMVDQLRIDRCMHGNSIVGDRCSNANQGRIADAFCAQQGFEEASAFETDFAPGASLAGFFPSSNSFGAIPVGLDIFTEVTCTRDS